MKANPRTLLRISVVLLDRYRAIEKERRETATLVYQEFEDIIVAYYFLSFPRNIV